jgi:predicted transcriptional regulator
MKATKTNRTLAVVPTAPATPVSRRDFDLARDTLLIKVSFSKWTGELGSDEVRDAAAKAEKADPGSIKGKIVALPAKAQKRVNHVQDAMGNLYKDNTRLWADGGWRMIMASDYPGLREKLNALVREYHDAVKADVIDKYEAHKADALTRLNGLIKDRFPGKEELAAKYDVRILIDKISPSQDFRIPGMSKNDVDELIKEREDQMAQLIAESNKDLIQRIAATVKALIDRLTTKDMRIVKGKHTESYPIFDNITLMVDTVERLNYAGDQKIADTVAKVRKELTNLDIDKIKDSAKEQKKVVKTAESVLDELSKF